MRPVIILTLSVWTVICARATADESADPMGELSARDAVRQGNELLTEGDAPAALEAYAHARGLRPDALEIPFVQGLGHYALKEYGEARDAFARAAVSKNRKLANDALYSAGASYHMEALDSADNPELAIEKLEHAIQRYHTVLADDPDHDAAGDAIVKAASLRRQIIQMREQQQQEQQQEGQCDNEKEQDEEQEQQQDRQQESKESEEQQEQRQSSEQSEEQQEGAQEQSASQQEEEQEEQEQMSQVEEKEEEDASREQAQRRLREMMQALRQREKHRQERVDPVPVAPVDKDW